MLALILAAALAAGPASAAEPVVPQNIQFVVAVTTGGRTQLCPIVHAINGLEELKDYGRPYDTGYVPIIKGKARDYGQISLETALNPPGSSIYLSDWARSRDPRELTIIFYSGDAGKTPELLPSRPKCPPRVEGYVGSIDLPQCRPYQWGVVLSGGASAPEPGLRTRERLDLGWDGVIIDDPAHLLPRFSVLDGQTNRFD